MPYILSILSAHLMRIKSLVLIFTGVGKKKQDGLPMVGNMKKIHLENVIQII